MTSNKDGAVSLDVIGCDFYVVLYSEDEPSNAIHCDNFNIVCIQNNTVNFNHTQGSAFYTKNIKALNISNCSIRTDKDIEKKLSTTTCASIQNVDKTKIQNCEFSDSRIGIALYNCNHCEVSDCLFNKSSVGIHIPKQSCICEISIDKTKFNACFEGLLCEGLSDHVKLNDCQFLDVLNPMLVNSKIRTDVKNCETKQSDEILLLQNCDTNIVDNDSTEVDETESYTSAPVLHMDNSITTKEDTSVSDDKHIENAEIDTDNLCDDLKVFLAVKKQLPYQVAVEDRHLLKDLLSLQS